MAEPSPSDEEPSPGGVSTFDVDDEPEPGPPEQPGPEPETADGQGVWDKRRWTIVGILLAAIVSTASILVARSILADVGLEIGLTETLIVGLIAFAVALLAFIPLRWGLWVVPLVAGAHYALNFYNMLFTDGTVYAFVAGDAVGYAVLAPAVGIAVGWVAQGLYLLIIPE